MEFMEVVERLRTLEKLYLRGVQASDGNAFSVETLLDVLVVLCNECGSSVIRREKSVAEFVEFGMYYFFYSEYIALLF